MTDLWQLTATELAQAYRSGDTTPSEVLAAIESRTASVDTGVRAFVSLDFESAMNAADLMTKQMARGSWRGPLHGVPVGVKDIFDVAGLPVTCGTEAFPVRKPIADARCVANLREAGAIVVGMTRTHEVAWGLTTQHERLGSVRNPWLTSRIPGGSSGGSAAAVASGCVPLALGTDTGGSCRLPAAFCGTTGWKPSYGSVSLEGVLPLAPSLDHVGALARSVSDLLIVDAVLRGAPDATRERMWRPAVLEDTTVAVLSSSEWPRLRSDHQKAFTDLYAVLAEVCKDVVEVRSRRIADAMYAHGVRQRAEAHDVHHRLLGSYPRNREAYLADVRGRLASGAETTFQEYLDAGPVSHAVRQEFASVLGVFDVVVSPVVPSGPPDVADPDVIENNGTIEPLRDVVMPFTVPQNLCGMPAAVVRIGFDDDGLPITVQVSGKYGHDSKTLAAALAIEHLIDADVRERWPNLN